MDKLKLVYKDVTERVEERNCHIIDPWFMPWMNKFFDIEEHGISSYYDPATTVFLANAYHGTSMMPDHYWYVDYIMTNRNVVLENVFESAISATKHVNWNIGDTYILNGVNWFWHREAFFNIEKGYKNYSPRRNYKKLALMPMYRDRYQRRATVLELLSLLDDMHWSYVDRGRHLPNDIRPLEHTPQYVTDEFDRHLNTEWYDDTSLSVVIETEVEHITVPFITEKTYKAISFFHPFMILGCAGTLEHLRNYGFKTFDNLWDETYDHLPNWEDRLKAIRRNLEKFKSEIWPQWQRNQAMDPDTLRRVKHNYALFYNMDVIEKNFTNEIIRPILEYVKKRNPGTPLPSTVDAYLSQPSN